MPVYPGAPDLSVMRLTVDPPTPVDPSATPTMAVTASLPQTITSQIPTGGTRVQKTVLPTNSAGVVTWTFSPAFQSPPAIAVVCEGDGSSVIAAQVTAVSATAVSVKVSKSSLNVNALLGLTIQVAVGTPGVTNVHLYAAPNPT